MSNNSGIQGLQLQDRARTASSQRDEPLPHPIELLDIKNTRVRELYAYHYRTPISATISAICGHIGGFPLDSIKTRMQTHPYNGIMDCVRNTYRLEGLAGFWRGVGPPILSVLINKTISFQVYEDTRHSLRTNFPIVFGGESIRQYGVVSATSGAVSGAAIAILSAPFELIKLRMQLDRILGAEQGYNSAGDKQSTDPSRSRSSTTPSTDTYTKQKPENAHASIKLARSHPITSSSSPPSSLSLNSSLTNTTSSSACLPNQHANTSTSLTCAKLTEPQSIRSFVPCSSSIHAAQEIVRSRGLFPGVYFGASLQLTRDVIGTSVYFGTYEVLKRNLLNYRVPAFAAQAISGGICGVFCWMVIFPIDFVKSIRQKDGLSAQPKFKSTLDCCRKLYKGCGWRIFYRGIAVTLCRAFPIHGCNLLVYEQTRAFITRYAGIPKDVI